MKRFIALLALLFALVMPLASAYAADTLEIKALDIQEDGTVHIALFASPAGELKADEFSILLGDKVVKPDAVRDYEDAGMGTTWLFVPDCYSNDMDDIRSVISGLINMLGKNDNAAIVDTGRVITDVRVTDDKAALLASCENLSKQNSNKRLTYQHIKTLLNAESVFENLRPHVNVVLISSDPAAKDESIYNQVLELARNTEFSINTVVFATEDGTNKSGPKQRVNDFNALAEACGDGLAQKFDHRKHNASTAVLEISNHEKKYRVIEFKPENMEWNSLQITYKKGDVILTDGIDLTEAQAAALAAAAPEPTATPEPTPEPTPVPKHIVVKDWVVENIVLVIAGAVLVVLVIVLIVMLLGKKKQPVEPDDTDANGTTPISENGNRGTEIIEEHEKVKRIMVRLEQVDAQHGRVYSAEMVDELIIGREASVSQIAIPDKKISGQHVKLSLRNGEMYLQDMGSRNGTKVNGMDISGMVPLRQQDKITLGLTTLRITWR